ncbi:FAD-dependent oxidoreductase [Rubrivivax rivuli]|uniref:FAD-dependent oxidoreductase n=1 Tax=Rubrivivax rivuli TaxID=1862385 RepID=A0A437RFG8_9BURK|nr:FAD-dependent oxidoreductase [Rubrivivax rivuli]RVU45493.1 FAD-dependent oxidoreductase [Rubrivivax rivuli]
MRIAIVGAGIVGVTTAFELATAGHEVTVFERRGSVASEGSFASGGLISPATLSPWGLPGAPWQRPRLRGAAALTQLPWLWRAWRARRPAAAVAQGQALQALGQFSRQRLLTLTQGLRLEFEQTPGCLVLLRGERDLKALQPLLARLRDGGVAHELADPERCRVLEPGLAEGTPLHAGLHIAQDGAGNCRQFAHLMKAEAQRLGARFRFDTPVQALRPGTPAVVVPEGGEPESFDAVIACTGADAAPLLARAGVKLPLVALHGYSVTAPLRHLDGLPPPGPRAALIDAREQVTLTRLGQRVRVSGMGELGGDLADVSLPPLRRLYRVLDTWFPGAVLERGAQHWKGARPMLPDGCPVLGASGQPGLWLNLGHGQHGWALACGSARVLADLVTGREAALDTAPLALQRLR